MDHERFWRIIEDAKREKPENSEAQAKAIESALKKCAADEILAFDMLYDEFRFRAYSWDLWGAAFLMNGGCSDDGFEYFRAWLISRGRDAYERAVADPDSLVDEFDPASDRYELESFFYAALAAYEAVTDDKMPERKRNFPELTGKSWEESELEALYPRIAAKLDD